MPASLMTPELVAEISALASRGMSDNAIAAEVGLAAITVRRWRYRHRLAPGRAADVERVPDPEPTPSAAPGLRAELVAAARPWAQRPWSAKGGA